MDSINCFTSVDHKDNEDCEVFHQKFDDTQPIVVDGQKSGASDGHHGFAINHNSNRQIGQPVIASDGQSKDADLSSICDTLRELHRQYQDLERAETALTLRIKAKCRRLCGGNKDEADKVYKSMLKDCKHDLAIYALSVSTPFIEARSIFEKSKKELKKRMTTMAKLLPGYQWVQTIKGFGDFGFVSIIGETGDLSNYSTHSKVWKRLGLAVINGECQQRKKGTEALEHGYSPSRRSVVWNRGDPLIKHGSVYADLYRTRKTFEIEKFESEGFTVLPANKIPEKNKEMYRSLGHAHNRAKRYMEKKLVRDLWREWNRV